MNFCDPAGFELLKTGGIMSICIYSGGDSGFEERDGVLEYLSQLDDRKYFIARQDFPNKRNNPPMPVFMDSIYLYYIEFSMNKKKGMRI